MKTKKAISLGALGGLALANSYWLGYLHGSGPMSRGDIIASVGLSLVFLWVLAKLMFAVIFSSGGQPPSNHRGGPPAPNAPAPLKPGPRPPGAPPDIYCEQQA
jgi:hypothetical protein